MRGRMDYEGYKISSLKLAVFGDYQEMENDQFRERIFRYLHSLGELTFFDFLCFSSIYSIVDIIPVIGTGNYLSNSLILQ